MYIRLFVTAASTTSLFWMSRNTDKGDLNSSNQEVLRMAHNFAKHLPFPEAEGRKKKKAKRRFTYREENRTEARICIHLVKNRSM